MEFDMSSRQTAVSIHGNDFHINDKPTYANRNWQGHRIEGLLLNSRMVQGIFDDLNPATHSMWDYPSQAPGGYGPFDADRNTNAFLAAMPQWKAHGLLAFTLNLQGGSPQGYSREQPWMNTAFNANGTWRKEYMQRTARILNRADELGMVVILGIFYFGQDHRLADESAVSDVVTHTIDWLMEHGYTNVVIEVANECDIRYKHDIIKPQRCVELIQQVKRRSEDKLLVSTSFSGHTIPPDHVIDASDFILLHGNGTNDPQLIRQMVHKVRASASYRNQPVVFNEDDHFEFDKPDNHFIAAISEHTGWGFFDYRMKGEGFEQGYQSMPCDWGINSDRKHGFFHLLKQITGA
jgi:hypothetical protein